MTDAAGNLELQGDGGDGLLTSTGIASALGVTDQTVRNWWKKGMREGGRDGKGRPLWRRSTAEAFRRTFRGDTLGGKRPGAGRPKGSGKRAPAPLIDAAEAAAAELQAQAEKAKALKQRVLMGEATPEEVMFVAGLPEDRGGVSKMEADRAQTLLRNAQLRQDLDKAAGKLIDADEAKERWSAALNRLRVALDGLPVKAAGEVLAALGIEAGKAMLVQMAVARAVEVVKGQIAQLGAAGAERAA